MGLKITEKSRAILEQFSRNGCFGTCVDCPRDTLGRAYPEFCQYKNRYDHLIDLDTLIEIVQREHQRATEQNHA